MPGHELNAEYMDIRRISAYLKLRVSTLYSLVEGKRIPHYKVGRLVRFKRTEIDLWMEGNKNEVVDISRTSKLMIRPARTPARDVNNLVKKTIEQVRGVAYTSSHGKPDKIKDLGKEE